MLSLSPLESLEWVNVVITGTNYASLLSTETQTFKHCTNCRHFSVTTKVSVGGEGFYEMWMCIISIVENVQ